MNAAAADDARPDETALAAFLAAGAVGAEAWRDGVGYPLAALAGMSPATQAQLVQRLAVRGWREVQVLAAIGTPAAQASLRQGFAAAGCARLEIGLALLTAAPQLLPEATRSELVCSAIAQARGGAGLDAALYAAEQWHPAPVRQALWRALHGADRVRVMHVAALLHYLLGLAAEPFDYDQCERFARFVAPDPAERAAARAELGARGGPGEFQALAEDAPC